jgi:hypothetical protein
MLYIGGHSEAQIFIYSCSAQLISFEIDCFYSLWTRIYEYLPPQLSTIPSPLWTLIPNSWFPVVQWSQRVEIDDILNILKQAFVGRDATIWKIYKENFDVNFARRLVTPDKGPSLETSKFSLYFSGSCIPTNKGLFILLADYLYTLAKTVQDILNIVH